MNKSLYNKIQCVLRKSTTILYIEVQALIDRLYLFNIAVIINIMMWREMLSCASQLVSIHTFYVNSYHYFLFIYIGLHIIISCFVDIIMDKKIVKLIETTFNISEVIIFFLSKIITSYSTKWMPGSLTQCVLNYCLLVLPGAMQQITGNRYR